MSLVSCTRVVLSLARPWRRRSRFTDTAVGRMSRGAAAVSSANTPGCGCFPKVNTVMISFSLWGSVTVARVWSPGKFSEGDCPSAGWVRLGSNFLTSILS